MHNQRASMGLKSLNSPKDAVTRGMNSERGIQIQSASAVAFMMPTIAITLAITTILAKSFPAPCVTVRVQLNTTHGRSLAARTKSA